MSVIIPVFNGEEFLAEAIESVLAQTYRAFEIIVCDDGSTDRSPTVLERFRGRINVVRQENQGVSAARNRAAAEARGTFMAFLDQDDAWEPHKLACQVEQIAREPGAGLVYAESSIIDQFGTLCGRRGDYLDYAHGRVFEQLLRRNFVPIETVLLPSKVFREVGGFDETLEYVEDWELCLRIAIRHEVAFWPEPLARYRIHARNLSHHREPLLAEWGALLGDLPKRLSPLPERAEKYLRRESSRRLGDAAWHALRRCDFATADAYLAMAPEPPPASLRARLRAFRAVLHALPAPWARRVGRALRAPKLLGVSRPTERTGH